MGERAYGCDVLLAGDGVEEVEVDDAALLQLLHQFHHVALRQAHAGLGALRRLQLPLQLQELCIHLRPPLSLARRGQVQGVMPPARSLTGDTEASATARSNGWGEVVTGRWAPADDGGVRKSRDGRGSGDWGCSGGPTSGPGAAPYCNCREGILFSLFFLNNFFSLV